MYAVTLTLALGACGEPTDNHTPNSASYQKTSDKPLQQILDDLEFAVTERNLRITGRLHIGEAIRDRKNPDYPDYEIILYCSLTFAKKMLELDPSLIGICPGRITVRENNNGYIIEAPLWPAESDDPELNAHMRVMNSKVREIVDYATERWLDVSDKNPQ